MAEQIMTLHPDPAKQGANVDKEKYDLVRGLILESVTDKPQTFMELRRVVEAKMIDFEGSPGWHYTTVKLDLEAKGEIICKRTPEGQGILKA